MAEASRPKQRRRAKGEGSIHHRKDGRWQASATFRLPDGSGKPLYFYGKTRQEVLAKLRSAQFAARSGTYAPGDRQTVAQYVEYWLEHQVKPTAQPHTYASYSGMCKRHIVPDLGGLPLQKVTMQHVQAFLNGKHSAGYAIGLLRAVLSRIFRDAGREGLIGRSPMQFIRVPRTAPASMPVWDKEQARRFLGGIPEHRLYALYLLALTLGLRRGELLGLSWEAVDLERGYLHVRANLSYIAPTGFIRGIPKHSSYRSIKLPQVAVDALWRHRDMQGYDRYLTKDWQDNQWDLVFTRENGAPIHPTALSGAFQWLVKALNKGGADLPLISFHGLRHSSASIALAEGVPVQVVSKRLGHSSIRITLDIYGHVLESMAQEDADKMDEMFGEGRDTMSNTL